MTTLLVTHQDCLIHDPGPGHPERPDRLRAVLAGLAAPDFAELRRADAPLALRDAIVRVHGEDLVAALEHAEPHNPGVQVSIDADTHMSAGSIAAAYRAVGGAIRAVDAVLGREVANAFVATRPPGHHAEARRPMGFCLFSNAAIAALYARERYGLARIAVIDFDVHHGNGTQDIFWTDPGLFYASTHQWPLYPGTGAAEERGASDNIVNVPLRAGGGSLPFRAAYRDVILPALERFAPELLIISAGFDAHEDDPLGGLLLTEDDFAWVTMELASMAARHCGGALVSLLEGGYDLSALSRCTAAHVRVLMAAGANTF